MLAKREIAAEWDNLSPTAPQLETTSRLELIPLYEEAGAGDDFMQAGLSASAVARDMSMLALLTCIIAIAFGWWMQKQGWGRCFRLKLKISFGVVLTQTLLTLICPLVTTETGFLVWLAGVSLALGVGMPVMLGI